MKPTPAFNTAVASGYQPANKNKRVIAFVIDILISGAVSKLFTVAVLNHMHLRFPGSLLLINFLFTASFYWVLLTYQFGATPGKKIMGLRIVKINQDVNLDLGQLFLRETVGRFASALPLMLGYIWVSWDKERRTFHDMIAKTRVVDFR